MRKLSTNQKSKFINHFIKTTVVFMLAIVPLFGVATTQTASAISSEVSASTPDAPSGFYFNKGEKDTSNKGIVDGSITNTAPLEQFISGKNQKFLWAHWNIDNSATYHIETFFKQSDGKWKSLHVSNNTKPNPYRFYGFGSQGDGLYRIKVTAISKSNPNAKSSPANAMVTYDSTAPQVTSIKLDTIKTIDGKDYTNSGLNNGKLKVTISTNEPLRLVGSQVGFKLPNMAGPPSTGWTKFKNGTGDDTGKYVADIDITGIHFDNKKIEDASIYLRVVDTVGNTDSFYYYKDGGFGDTFSKRYLFTIDNQAPQLPNNLRLQIRSNGSYIANDNWTNKSDVTALWDSDNSEQVTYEYQYWNDVPSSVWKDDHRWKMPTNSTEYAGVVNQGDGKHYFCVVAIDIVGNRSGCSDSFGFNYDNTPPSATVAYSGGFTKNDVIYLRSIEDLSFSVSTSDNFAISRAVYLIRSVDNPTLEACGNWNAGSLTNHNFDFPYALNATYAVNGSSIKTCDPSMLWQSGSRYKVIHAVYDASSNEYKFNIPEQLIEIDNTQPIINIVKPLKDTTVSGVVPIEVKITENGSGIKYVNALFSDGPGPEFGKITLTLKPDTTDTYVGTIDTAGKNGKYSLTINTADNLKNTRSSKAQNITIDNTAPAKPSGLRFFATNDSVEVTQNNSTIARQAVYPRWDAVIANINGGNEDVDHYNYRSRGGYKTTIVGTDASADSTIKNWVPPTDLTDGFRVQAVDKAGNEGEWSDWFDFTFNSVIPPEETDSNTNVPPPQTPEQTPVTLPTQPVTPFEDLPTPTTTSPQANNGTASTPTTTPTGTNINTAPNQGTNQPNLIGQGATAGVLGDDTNNTGQQENSSSNQNNRGPANASEVKSAVSSQEISDKTCQKLFGICWYYWIPVFIVSVITTWYLVAKAIKKDEQKAA